MWDGKHQKYDEIEEKGDQSLTSTTQFFQHILYYNNTSTIKEKSLKKQRNERGKNLNDETMSKFDQMNKNEKLKGRGLIITLIRE
jgi:hypothetical protein